MGRVLPHHVPKRLPVMPFIMESWRKPGWDDWCMAWNFSSQNVSKETRKITIFTQNIPGLLESKFFFAMTINKLLPWLQSPDYFFVELRPTGWCLRFDRLLHLLRMATHDSCRIFWGPNLIYWIPEKHRIPINSLALNFQRTKKQARTQHGSFEEILPGKTTNMNHK